MRFRIALLLSATLSLAHAQQYLLQSSFSGPTFFDNFDFWTAGDPTFGYVHYVDRATAEQYGMLNSTSNTTTWGVDTTQVLDPMANLGRLSVRLTSVQSWTHGLFILDLAHMPVNECGVWPAWWTLGSGTWPENGEIDIIESTNNLPNNLMALHTAETPNCTVAGADQSGNLLTANCAAAGGYTGVWFFGRDEVPASITEASDTGPDPSAFGVPIANFQGSCDIDAHFFNHSMVFDTTFCGSYAGNTWQGDGCPLIDPTNGWQSCDDFVATNPQAFVDAYWQVNYLNVYQTAAGQQTTSSSSLSSVTPAIQTSSVSTALSGAQGRSTTPSGTPSPVTTTPTSTPASFSGMSPSSASTPPTISSVPYSSPTLTPGYATTVVVVVTVGVKKAATLSPQVGGEQQQLMSAESQQPLKPRQVVEASTTYWPEPYPTAYCEANPSACAASLKKRDDDLSPIIPVLGGPDDPFLEPASVESDLSEHDNKQDAGQSSVLPGGSVNYCGVPGSFCAKPKPSHREREEIEIPQHVDVPSIAQSMASLLLPPFPHHPTGPPPVVPYVGPNGIVYEPPKDKRDAEPQTMPGASINFCCMPGSACDEHHAKVLAEKRAPKLTPGPNASIDPCFNPAALNTVFRQADAATTPAPTAAPLVDRQEEKVPHTASSMTYLMEPPVAPNVGPDGIVHEPGATGYPPGCKREVENSDFLTEVKIPHTETSMLYLMLPPWTPPPYTFETFAYDPLTKRTAEPSVPTFVPDVLDSEVLTEVKVPQIAESMLSLMVPTWTPPPYTFETFAYDPLTKRTAEPVMPTEPLPKKDDPLQPTAPAGVLPKEGPDQPSTTGRHHGHIASITCTPVVLLGQDGNPSATGCFPPLNVKITKSEPVVVADATRTATIPAGVEPQDTVLDWGYEGLIDDVARNAASVVSAGVWTAVVTALAVFTALLF